MFRVHHVPDDAHKVSEDSFEPIGTKYKFWFLEASKRLLFKQVTEGTGEDWSEKIACELCRLLEIPHAHYDLAIWQGNRGVVTTNFLPSRGRLIFGNELLLKLHSDYPQGGGSRHFYRITQHTLFRVLAVMKVKGLQAPIGWQPLPFVSTPLDVFVGYLMFDAWIGNQDRHHQNWALIYSPVSGAHLAPTFDHASSLGRNEKDETRLTRLATTDQQRGMTGYVEKARSAFYESTTSEKPMSTLEAFRLAAAVAPGAADTWLNRLAQISHNQACGLLGEIPPDRISRPAIDFAAKMLEINKFRLLDLRRGHRK